MENIKERVHEDFVKLKDNRESYFDEFYKNNYNLVYRICFSILKDKENSEDVVQTIFEKIYKMPDDKIASNYESSWLYTVSKNEAIQFLRAKKYNLPIDEQLYDLQDQKNDINEIEENEQYRNLVKKLDKKQEQIVSLKVLSDFTFKEIGEILSMPTATVQWYYYKSIRFLRLAIGNLAMFVLAFTAGLVYLRKEERNISQKDNQTKNNTVKDAENVQSEASTGDKSDYTEKTNITDFSKVMGENSNIEQAEIATDSFGGISISKPMIAFSIAGIFLCLTIIFTVICVKHRNKKKM